MVYAFGGVSRADRDGGEILEGCKRAYFILLVAATAVPAFSEGGHHRGDQSEEADARRAGAVRAAAVARLFEVVRDREPA